MKWLRGQVAVLTHDTAPPPGESMQDWVVG